MNGRLCGRTEFFDCRVQRGGVEFEADGNRAHRRHDLRLADEYDRPRGIGGAVRCHRRQAADRADFAIGERFLAINLCRVHGCLTAIGAHAWATPLRFVTAKANPSSLQRRLGGPDTIPGLAHPVTTHKVPAWTTLLGIALFGLALFWLHHLLGQYRWQDVLAHVHAISTTKVLRAGLFTVAGYGCLTLYDALAVHFAVRACRTPASP